MSWYRFGADALEEAARLDAEAERRKNAPWRFWLKAGGSAEIVFLDKPVTVNGETIYPWFGVLEHNMRKDGKWGNYYTCRRDLDECPLCEAGYRPSYAIYLTIIDLTEYETKDGRTVKGTKKLFPIKRKLLNKFKRKLKDAGGSLYLKKFRIYRDSVDDLSTGEDIEFIGDATEEELLACKPSDVAPEEWLAPFDYKKIFEPLPVEELRRIAGLAPPKGLLSKDSNVEAVDDETLNQIL